MVPTLGDSNPTEDEKQVDRLADDFERELKAGANPRIEECLQDSPELRTPLLKELLIAELEFRRGKGQEPDAAEYHQRFPDHREVIAAVFAKRDGLTTLSEAGAEEPGETIGPFKLLQQIGEGGMGSVWMAQQEKPVKRRVALKVIKAGMDSKQVIARFEAERQALSMMDHANIAHVLDAGTTGEGRPYFVMELVKGLPITKYCDDEKLGINDRLTLFSAVCRAVQHAHQKGIIHRDLKPSNIQVAEYDGEAIPKIIDFGLAKALHQTLTDKTVFTQLGQVVGTLAYMSPEQSKMNQLEVDTRTDIYSLGVILYELLTGSTPFDRRRFRKAALDEVMKIIREEEPPKPSTRLSSIESLPSVAANRRTEPRKLSGFVRGDLDWIVMKAMDKERGRRYESATGLAMDVQRYLNDEPVVACPPSAGYRLKKFVRRNKVAVLAGTLVAVALLLGILGTGSQAIRAINFLKNERVARIEADGATQRAEAEAEKRRRLLYVSDMNVAMQAWEDGNVAQVVDAVDRHFPLGGQVDLRRFEWYYLWNASRQAVNAPSLHHGGAIFWIAVSPYGEYLASGGFDLKVKLWKRADGNQQYVLNGELLGHENAVSSVSFDPESRYLATGSWDTTIRIWDVQTGKLVRELLGHTSRVDCVAFCPTDANLLVSASGGTQDDKVRFWNVDKGEQVSTLSLPEGANRTYCVAFSPDGELVAFPASHDISQGGDSEIHIWRYKTNERVRQLTVQNSVVWGLEFSRSGELLAVSGARPGTISLWEVGSGELLRQFREDAYFTPSVSFSKDEKTLATSDYDGKIRIWDLTSGDLENVINGHGGAVTSALFLPFGNQTIASSSIDGTVKLWTKPTLSSSGYILRPKLGTRPIYAPDGKSLITAHLGITIWTKDGRGLWSTERTIFEGKGYGEEITSAAITQDSRRLVTGHRYVPPIIWDLQSEKKIGQLDAFSNPEMRSPMDTYGVCLLDKDATIAVTHRTSPDVELWDLASLKKTGVLKGPPGLGVWRLATAYGHDLLAVGYKDGSVSIWNMKLRKQVADLAAHYTPISGLAISANGRWLASAARNGEILIWNTQDWKLVGKLKGHLNSVFALAWFQTNEDSLASASLDQTVRLWDIASMSERAKFAADQEFHTLAIHPGDTELASAASSNNATYIWRAPRHIQSSTGQ